MDWQIFMEGIVKALPNAVLDAFITIILAGVILFIFQERIKTSLAKSLYEHQIRFSTTYQKRVEVAETLYRKFLVLSDTMEAIMHTFRDVKKGMPGMKQFDDKEYFLKCDTEIEDRFDDFWNYYRNNRIYFSEEHTDIVQKVYQRVSFIKNVMWTIIDNYDEITVIPTQLIDICRKILRYKPLNEDNYDWGQLQQPAEFVNIMAMTLQGDVRSLEFLYKSVADTQ
jgi:hypothetical protein